jgi:hypothetical protein
MGKASSMESLSPKKDLQRIDEEGGMAKNKMMSQSTSDIFRFGPEILSFKLRCANRDFYFSIDPPMAVVRCPSMNKLLGSELSTSCGSLGTRRPRSCHASTESLPTFFPSTLKAETFYCCPSGDDCFEEKLTNAKLIQHINEIHQLPVISFGSSSAEVPLPPRAPLENASLILLLDEKQFWVKVAADE